MDVLLANLPIAVIMALVGALVFALVGVVSGTDETATIAPLTLVVILLGVPPAGIFTFFLAGAIAKHMTHAVPTMLLGIPGDTMAVPILDDARQMSALGLPHLALRKAVAGGVISAFIAIPLAVFFAWALTPIESFISDAAPWVFLLAALGIAYASAGKWAAVVTLPIFVVFILGLQAWTATLDVKLGTSYFLGMAVGTMMVSLISTLVPATRKQLKRTQPNTVYLAPEMRGAKNRSSFYPNPFRILDRKQVQATVASATISSATFVFSPVAMTVLMGEIVGRRIKQGYERLTSVITAKNATTESTYVAEALIPLIAFGLPLSPVAAGPAAPLFNAPPVFETNPDGGVVNNLSTHLNDIQFLIYGLIAAIGAVIIAYPFVMRYAHGAAKFVVSKVSHEATISAFVGLVVVVSMWEGGVIGLLVTVAVGLVGGCLITIVRLHAGVLYMGYYVAVLSVPTILALVT